ncbi:MAG: hypothetical protein B6I34_05920 [Anaerolineaceae bacterium 4572_32.1]|nr:MAG: hypothetical protein B6I34_05920 [Anaerolineaceae bacterium 4572_32.1]
MKRLVIIIIVLVLVGVGICVGGSMLAPKLINKNESAPLAPKTPLAAASSIIRARGKLVPIRVETLSFAASGMIDQLDVEVGDEVTAGQVIARLDTSEIEWAVRQAEDALTAARLTYSQTVRAALPEDIAGAQAALNSAEAGLVSAQAGLISTRIALTNTLAARDAVTDTRLAAQANLNSAQASLTSARASLTALQSGPDSDAVEQARLSWEQARNSLARLQLERDAMQARPGVPGYMLEQMKLDIANAEIAVRLAEISYLKIQGAGATEETLAAARASVAAAEVGVINAQAQVDSVDEQSVQTEASIAQAEAAVTQAEAGVTQAEASVQQAQAALERLLAGPDELAVAQVRLNVRQAEAALERAGANLLDVEIIAPFSGVISAVTAKEGGPAAAGAPVVTVVDLSSWKVETEDLDEWGVNHINTDEPVQLVFTAFDDKTLSGHIEKIDFTPTQLPTGDVAYKVTIVLDEFDPALRWGMSVRAEFAKIE